VVLPAGLRRVDRVDLGRSEDGSSPVTFRRRLTLPKQLDYVLLTGLVAACVSPSPPAADVPALDADADAVADADASWVDDAPPGLDVPPGYTEQLPGVFCSRTTPNTTSLCFGCTTASPPLLGCGRCVVAAGPPCVLCFDPDGGADASAYCA